MTAEQLDAAPALLREKLDAIIDRFLAWPLPKDFSPDCGISFDGRKDDEWNKNKSWPIGTNLFTGEQARAMLRYVLAATPQPSMADEHEATARIGWSATPIAAPPEPMIERAKDDHAMHEFYCELLRDLLRAAQSYRTAFPPTVTNRVSMDAADTLADKCRETEQFLADGEIAPAIAAPALDELVEQALREADDMRAYYGGGPTRPEALLRECADALSAAREREQRQQERGDQLWQECENLRLRLAEVDRYREALRELVHAHDSGTTAEEMAAWDRARALAD